MVNRNLIRGLDLSEEEWQSELSTALAGTPPEEIDWGGQEVAINQIIEGRVIRIEGDFVLVDVGYKSEGIILRSEWEDDEPPPEPGQMIKVLIEDVEDVYGLVDESRGMITLSKRKAEKIEAWLKVMETVHEGDVVTGMVTRKIKGGLLVDIGVNVFLPASQVDIRRPADIGDYIGRTIQCIVLKIDEAPAEHRRQPPRADRSRAGREEGPVARPSWKSGQLRKGVVKNIAEFGAFVDLGGIDGLLHITDMSWGRINHPSEMVSIDQEIEVQILHIDHEKEKIALGLKQKTASPWEQVEEKYPGRLAVRGTVVNVMSYGAFVKLEEGIEGLVHISEMSWTKRISHPSELVADRRRDRRGRAGHQQGEAGDLPGHEADPGKPLGPRGRPLSARQRGQGHGPQPHQLRGLHRDRRRDRRPAARQRHVVDPQDQPSQRDGREGPGDRVPRAFRGPGSPPHRLGPEAARRRPLGQRHPRQVSSRARSSRAR